MLEKFSRAIDQTSTILDHRTFGGALILGVRGRAVVCHGAADKISIKNAILMLHKKSISEQLQSRKKE